MSAPIRFLLKDKDHILEKTLHLPIMGRSTHIKAVMRIGDLAKSSAVSAKMIRHYEAIGLIVPGARTANGYREYGERDIHELRFIRSARDLGFSLDEIRDLLDLWRNKKRRSRDVHALAKRHLVEIESRIERFEAMAATLRGLMADCHDDERPDCPILKGLSAH